MSFVRPEGRAAEIQRVSADYFTLQTYLTSMTYPQAVLPAVVGMLIGVVITTVMTSHAPDHLLYVSLPEYQLWRVVMVAQISVYVFVSAYVWNTRNDTELPRLRRGEAMATAAMTIIVVLLPNILTRGGHFPMQAQRLRMLAVVGFALIAILLVMNRVARVFAALLAPSDVSTHLTLREHTRDLLMVAGLVVTLGTLGSGVLQLSLAAIDKASTSYESHLAKGDVLAYGAYFTLVLLLFFTPLLVAERRAAVRLVRSPPTDAPASEVEARLGLRTSLTEYLASAFGVLSPLLGALATRLLT